jgi:hypothetical protein
MSETADRTSSKTEEMFRNFVEGQRDVTIALAREATGVAEKYARLAPAQRPSYLGIFLILIAVIIEAVHACIGYLFDFSQTMLMVMLVGGLLILLGGSAMDTMMFWLQMKHIRESERELGNQRSAAFTWFRGSRDS